MGKFVLPAAALLSTALPLAADSARAAEGDWRTLKAQIQQMQQRLNNLEQQNQALERALATERLSETEPEVATRLKAVEAQAAHLQKPVRVIEGLAGISAGLSLTTVTQTPAHAVSQPGAVIDGASGKSQLNYRGDATATLPLEGIGATEQKLFVHARFGQGVGLNDLYAFSKPNATAFRVTSTKPDDSVAIIGEAWYQASIPLSANGAMPNARQTLEVNFGKMDPFAFFDQNRVANDETRQFVNAAFVHNPLLDAGGDIGVDANGFAPGLRLAYIDRTEASEPWRLSFGLFGAGEGANYQRFYSAPLVIAQAETQLKFFGLSGNYRAYAWRNDQAPGFAGAATEHSGWGVSADQQVADATRLFLRYGQLQHAHEARFDRALTFGFERAGYDWGRAADAFGLAVGALRVSADFQAHSGAVMSDAEGKLNTEGAGTPYYGYAARGTERVLELYYRYRISRQFELSPHFQMIARPGGNAQADNYRLLGLRAQLCY